MSAEKGLNNEEEITEENGPVVRPDGEGLKCSTECQEDMQFDSVLSLGQLPEKALTEGSTPVADVSGGSPSKVDVCDGQPPVGDIEARSKFENITPFWSPEDIVWDETLDVEDAELTPKKPSTPTPSYIFQLMHNYGPQIVPNDIRNDIWTATKADLQKMISDGLIPEDTMDSAGIDPESYEHFMNCVTEIRDKIWEDELRTALSILRGARRIFSASKDIDLRHVFCGPPIEVLADIYYDGIGVLPKNRMTEDPFHHSLFSNRLCDE